MIQEGMKILEPRSDPILSDGSYPREITERIPEFQVGPSEASISSVVFLFSVFFSP